MNPFATHIPLLLACLRKTSGPVLELGAGWFSTPIMAAFATNRLVRTIETSREWFEKIHQVCTYQPITNHRHQIIYSPNYDDAPMFDHHWSIVFLDHEPPPRRGFDAERLIDKCDLMIGHDAEHPDYRYAAPFDKLKYRYTLQRVFPFTVVGSNTDPLDWLDDALKPLW